MSGTQSALFGGGSRYITNPKHLPIVSVDSAALVVKEAITTKTASNVAGFYTAIAKDGASAAITVADTYVTVCNLSGAGFLFNCVSPTHSSAFTPTIRITVDGIAYTIAPSANQTALWRMVLGPLTIGVSIAGAATAAVAGDTIALNSAWDAGFNRSKVGGVRQYGATSTDLLAVPSESAILTYGLPALRFESSLLVEMKASGLSANAADKQCAATYRLDL